MWRGANQRSLKARFGRQLRNPLGKHSLERFIEHFAHGAVEAMSQQAELFVIGFLMFVGGRIAALELGVVEPRGSCLRG